MFYFLLSNPTRLYGRMIDRQPSALGSCVGEWYPFVKMGLNASTWTGRDFLYSLSTVFYPYLPCVIKCVEYFHCTLCTTYLWMLSEKAKREKDKKKLDKSLVEGCWQQHLLWNGLLWTSCQQKLLSCTDFTAFFYVLWRKLVGKNPLAA